MNCNLFYADWVISIETHFQLPNTATLPKAITKKRPRQAAMNSNNVGIAGNVVEGFITSYTELLDDVVRQVDVQLYGLPRPYYNSLDPVYGTSFRSQTTISPASGPDVVDDVFYYSPWLHPFLSIALHDGPQPVAGNGYEERIYFENEELPESRDGANQNASTTHRSRKHYVTPYVIGSTPNPTRNDQYHDSFDGMNLINYSDGSNGLVIGAARYPKQKTLSHMRSHAAPPSSLSQSSNFGYLSYQDPECLPGFRDTTPYPMPPMEVASYIMSPSNMDVSNPTFGPSTSSPSIHQSQNNADFARRRPGRPPNSSNIKGRGNHPNAEFDRIYQTVLKNPRATYDPRVHGKDKVLYNSARRKMHYNRTKREKTAKNFESASNKRATSDSDKK